MTHKSDVPAAGAVANTAVTPTVPPAVRNAALGVLALALLAAGYYGYAISRPRDFGAQTWVIERGDTLAQVAAQLRERGVIAETVTLRLLARVGDRGRRIRAGEYRVPARTSLQQFLHRIVRGDGQVGIKVTLIEGWTFRQMRAHLRRAPNLKQVAAAMSDEQLMAELGHPEWHPEGRFFPDTYYYRAGDDDLSVYRQAFLLMQEKLNFAWQDRGDDQVLGNMDEALILASIIEKESYIADELRQIAGVFHNRLQKGMRLQADPTVIYGLGDALKGRLTRAHLKRDGPYNTYLRDGLPPTPISLPGEAALIAATQPARGSAYYFVAAGNGRHRFSKTLEQHNKAVREYRRKRKSG